MDICCIVDNRQRFWVPVVNPKCTLRSVTWNLRRLSHEDYLKYKILWRQRLTFTLHRIYPNVSYYCNVTYKNLHFTLRYTIVDISTTESHLQCSCILEQTKFERVHVVNRTNQLTNGGSLETTSLPLTLSKE